VSQPPKPTEQIYLSGPSVMPVLFAAGLAGVVIGLYAWWPYAAIGGVVLFVALVGWLRANRRDIAAMPNEQQTETGPIPLSGRE
jgi:membrane-bound ClpP family serine protease